jgi:cell division protease FtsH
MGGSDRDYSEDTARRIDEEVAGIIASSYRRAIEVLGKRRDTLEDVVEVLFETEIMEGDHLRRLLGKTPAAGDPISGNGTAVAPAADPTAAEVADPPGTGAPVDETPGDDAPN